MEGQTIAAIDWTRPWYDTVRPAFDGLGPDVTLEAFVAPFNANAARLGLANAAGRPVRFVPQAELPPGEAYEAFIGATGCVPTRANLHDFFNGLVWQTFPRTKRALNALQAAQIAAAGGVGRSRGPARDAATIFDENAALLLVRDDAPGRAVVDDLRAHRWPQALLEARASWGSSVEPWLFGHALMEKLVAPRKAITAHVVVVFAPGSVFGLPWDARRDWIDGRVAATLAVGGLTTAAFTPLPVLGIPGWWPGQDGDFYADAAVFRPPRNIVHKIRQQLT